MVAELLRLHFGDGALHMYICIYKCICIYVCVYVFIDIHSGLYCGCVAAVALWGWCAAHVNMYVYVCICI